MIDWFDITVGQLLGSIEDRERTDNTLVVYLADNGWIQNPDVENQFTWPSKLSPYDKGIRTHMTYKWPGQIQAEMDTTTFVSANDMVPTILDILDIEPEGELPGVNVLDREVRNAREAVYSEDYNHDIADVHNPTESVEHLMVMRSPWKLIITKGQNGEERYRGSGRVQEPTLYHIVNDPKEQYNVALQNPEVVNELRQIIDNWWKPAF